MACVSAIAKNILADCTVFGVGGLEIKVWIMNRLDILSFTADVTYPNTKITAMAMKSTKRAWTITGYKKNLNAGFDVVISEDMPKKYSHFFALKGYEFDAASVQNFDAMEDLVVIVESKDKPTDADGTFRVFGLKNGLYTSTDTMRANDAYGSRAIELTSLAGQEESQSQINFDSGTYAQSLAALVALETPAT